MKAKSKISLWAVLIAGLVFSRVPAQAAEYGSYIYESPDYVYAQAYTELDYYENDFGFDAAYVDAYTDSGAYEYTYGYFGAEVEVDEPTRPGCSVYEIFGEHAIGMLSSWYFYTVGYSQATDYYCTDTGGGGGGGNNPPVCQGSPPSISNISPDHGLASGGYIPIYGSNFTANGSPQVMMDGYPLTNLVYTSDGQINAQYGTQSLAVHEITVSTPCGTSNEVDFTVVSADSTPYISSISPTTWAAGTTVQLQINGTGFGMAPQLEIDATGVTVSSMTGWDTGITATLIIDPSAPDQFNVPVTVTSTGIWGQGFLGNPGQLNYGQAQIVTVQGGGQPPQLSCPTSVTRGGQIACTISNAAPGNVTSWSFTDGVTTVPGSPGTTTWNGIMVQSGTISATVSGRTLTATVAVQPRGWQTQPAQPVEVSNGTLTVTLSVPPVADANNFLLLGWSEASFQWSRPGRSTVSTGPNAGYGYYASSLSLNSSTFWYKYIIDPDLENDNSAFSQHQCGGNSGFISWSDLLAGTRRHEYNSATQSHWAFYANGVNASANNFDAYLEGRVAQPSLNASAFDSETDGQLAARANQVVAATQQEPYPINYSETGIFLGNVNIGPNYANCN